MPTEKEEKTSEGVTEEEQQHEPAQPEPEPESDEDNQDECDEAIGQLLATINALDARVAELERKLEQHGIEYEHARRVEDRPADGSESTPEERHFYFRRVGKH